jgi:predicted transcriptional regulator
VVVPPAQEKCEKMYRILVQDVAGHNEINSVIAHEDASIVEVLTHLVHNAGLCGVFVIDSGGLVSGVITRSTLVRWARVCMSDLSAHVPVGDIFRMISVAKARDLAVGDGRTLGVRRTDPLSKVLHQLTSYDISAIPVVDADGRITGDLTIGQLLMKALEVRIH